MEDFFFPVDQEEKKYAPVLTGGWMTRLTRIGVGLPAGASGSPSPRAAASGGPGRSPNVQLTEGPEQCCVVRETC